MKAVIGLVFFIGTSLAFDKQAWIAKMAKYAHFNEKNEIIIEADCYETPNTRLVSKLFPEPTNTLIANAITNGQDPTQLLDPLCYENQDPEVWKTLDELVFGGKPCGVEVRFDIFKTIEDFGNERCDNGCDIDAIEAELKANWGKIQPFFDFLNKWIKSSATMTWTWTYCEERATAALFAVRDAVVKAGKCKKKALDLFLYEGHGLFDQDDVYQKGRAKELCYNLSRYKNSNDAKSYYKLWPQDARGIAENVMIRLFRVGVEH